MWEVIKVREILFCRSNEAPRNSTALLTKLAAETHIEEEKFIEATGKVEKFPKLWAGYEPHTCDINKEEGQNLVYINSYI